MIRFPCPNCQKTLKVPETKAGATATCPSCKERCRVPSELADDPDAAESEPEPVKSPKPSNRQNSADAKPHEQPPSRWAAMSTLVRLILIFFAGGGIICLLLAIFAPFLPVQAATAASIRHYCTLLFFAGLIGSIVTLHGYGMSCPSCHMWWMQEKIDTKEVDRENFDNAEGVPFKRITYQTNFQCKRCRHRWHTTYSDEMKRSTKRRPKRDED